MSTPSVSLPEPVRAFLKERRFAVLGTTMPDGAPHLSVMWYDLRGDQILMNTAAGRVKAANLDRNPVVAICVEDEERYVTLRGRVELNYDQSVSQADIRALAVRYDGVESGNKQADGHFSRQQRITLLMTIEGLTVHGFNE